MTPAINPPAALGLDFPAMSAHSLRPPYAVPAADQAAKLDQLIDDRRAFNARMIAKGSLSDAAAAAGLAPLLDLAADLAAPAAWPRSQRTHSWADKGAELRRIIAQRRAALDARPDPALVPRIEALEAIHWRMTIGLEWCDAFDDIADRAICLATIRAWTWAIGLAERRAADAGEPWARPDRSTASRSAWYADRPAIAADAAALDQAEQTAAIELGIAVLDRAA